jgi:outer membrane receptor for ferrienterochelin and colicin
VPIIGDMNRLPLIEALNIEVGLRLDDYTEFGSVFTPKLSATRSTSLLATIQGRSPQTRI